MFESFLGTKIGWLNDLINMTWFFFVQYLDKMAVKVKILNYISLYGVWLNNYRSSVVIEQCHLQPQIFTVQGTKNIISTGASLTRAKNK